MRRKRTLERIYDLLDEELLFNINAMFRISPVRLNKRPDAETVVFALPADEQRRLKEVASDSE
jgi:hypothetical protein